MTPRLQGLLWLAWLVGCSAAGPAGDRDARAGRDAAAETTARDQQSAPDRRAGDTDGPWGEGAMPADECVEATGPAPVTRGQLLDDPRGRVQVTSRGLPCARTFELSSTATRRDDLPASPRTVSERLDAPSVSTNNPLFDALYALALAEAREDSVAAIEDGAFDHGAPLPCPSGGCFETGRLWKYVWTRDISYATELALATLDPTRARNSMELKTSGLRGGGAPQIVQDTGTGGSYPVSSDRAVWALGARRLLEVLVGSERTAFRDHATEVVINTIEHDRQVVFDARDGLYRGEQSFLDWREQSYPAWVADDPVQIAVSKALSTNVCHLALLELGADLADETGDATRAGRYRGWASALRAAVAARFALTGRDLFATFIPSELDPAPVQHHDLLGTALAILHDVFDAARAQEAVASYPHLPFGAPVIWPQQQQVPIYHNRAIWPFVSAYWLKAARKVGNAEVVDHNVRSLMHAAALNLSNMENLELVSGEPYLADGASSGPVVNSQRQLWSVAGYLAMVQDVIFGLEIGPEGLRAQPYITATMRNALFAAADTLALNNFAYHGGRLQLIVHLPPRADTPAGGAYAISAVRLDGVDVGARVIGHGELAGGAHRLDVHLAQLPGPAASITRVDDVSDYRLLFAPRTPSIAALSLVNGQIELTLEGGGEQAADITFNVYRDGARVASALPGGSRSWRDADSSASASSHCYALESIFVGSQNASQRSRPACYWGAGTERVTTFGAAAFVASGGSLSSDYGKLHYQLWGDPGDTLTLSDVTPTHSGPHLLQLVAGNGAGPISTGVTAGVKSVRVAEVGGAVIADAPLLMPQLGRWDAWRGSSFLALTLDRSKRYRITIYHDDKSINMSALAHFEHYTGGLGGADGAFHRVNIAELKLLALDPS